MLRNTIVDNEKEYSIISNRFGRFEVSPANQIHFNHGIIGLPDYDAYYLLTIANPKLSAFYLLSAKDDPELTFLVIPISNLNFAYHIDDMQILLNETQYQKEDVVILLIATVHSNKEKVVTFTANAQAPIVLSKSTSQAKQCVLANPEYKLNMDL